MYISNKLAEYEMEIQVFTDCQAHYMLNTEVYKDKAIAAKKAKNLVGHQVNFSINGTSKHIGRNITSDLVNWYSLLE